ncbi:Phosducin-like protein 2 [Phlyctochytrium planicorne]|nr:Phosducin-like protein 2 [Phlyctochytrium planicorne]
MSDEVIIAALNNLVVDEKSDGIRAMNAVPAVDLPSTHDHHHTDECSHPTEDGRRSPDWADKEKAPSRVAVPPPNTKSTRIVQDNMTRQSLGIGGAMTGPKGVIADFKFHERQERARAVEKARAETIKLSSTAMKSGWIEREIQREENEKMGVESLEEMGDDEEDALIRLLESEEDEYLKEYRYRRMKEMSQNVGKSVYGEFIEIDVDEYVEAIEGSDVDPATTVVIHLYQPNLDACRLVNAFLSVLAPKYPLVKFLRIVSTKADANFDPVALPALLIYRAGEMVEALMRVDDEIEGWKNGRCDVVDFEGFLVGKGVLRGGDKDGQATNAAARLKIRAALNSLDD